MTLYVFKCEECGQELDRDFPMGEAPQFIRSDCDEKGKANVKCYRVFLPLSHRWVDGRKGAEMVKEQAHDIRTSGKYDIAY